MEVPTHYYAPVPVPHAHEFRGSPVIAHSTGAQIMQSAGHCPECHHATTYVKEQLPAVGISRYLPTGGQMVGLTFLLGGVAAVIVAALMAFAAFALALGLAALAMTVMSIVVVILIKEMRGPAGRKKG